LQKMSTLRPRICPRSVVDLHHNPEARPVFSKRGQLPCLIKHMGVMFDTDVGRPWTASELMTAMGLPIANNHQTMTGSSCQFSRGAEAQAPEARSHSSRCQQIGNAMHTAVIGSFTLQCVLAFPTLGVLVAPAPSSDSSSTVASSSSNSPALGVLVAPVPSRESSSTDASSCSNSPAPSSAFSVAFANLHKRRRLLKHGTSGTSDLD
jgi:hypothetical protein